jgi:hypothetical protein
MSNISSSHKLASIRPAWHFDLTENDYFKSEVTDNCALRTHTMDELCSANVPAYRAFHYVVDSYFAKYDVHPSQHIV